MFSDAAILLPAFIAGSLILATHIPLGVEVLKRKIVFIDLAIAQIASLGMILPLMFGRDDWLHGSPWALQAFTLMFALFGAFLIEKLRLVFKDYQEALVGTIYVISFSAAVLIASGNVHGAEHLSRVVDGQLLWATYQQSAILVAVTVSLFGLLWLKPNILSGRAFYYLMAAIVVISVQMVGVYMVFAALIIPALFNTKLHYSLMSLVVISSVTLAMGLVLSLNTDLPTSPLIICSLLIGFALLVFKKSFKSNAF